MPAVPPHPFFLYSAEVLAWRLGGGQAAPPPPAAPPEATAARAARVLRVLGGRRRIALLGLGSGDLAAALAAALPENTTLNVVCLAPDTARESLAAGRLPWLTPDGPAQLVADASAQAACQLLWANGLTPENALVTVNPEPADPAEVKGLALVRRLLTAGRRLPDTGPTPAGQPLPTLALLARADEPSLEAFFEAARGLASQAVIVWDACEVPPAAEAAARLDIPVRHLARPLAGDFAAQRNAGLDACPPGWVLSLDPDERPGPGFAAAVARIMACPEAGAAYFPRLTLYPDPGRAKVGHGLWPDWQLRLFRTDAAPGPRYVRPLHERLEGHPGTAVLALDAPILHHNRLLADAACVADKLEAFSQVAGAARHRLSADYPTLPLGFFASLAPSGGPGRCLLLPPGLQPQPRPETDASGQGLAEVALAAWRSYTPFRPCRPCHSSPGVSRRYMMRITCPQCGFFREIPDTKAPVTPTMATCPKCRHRFRFRPQPAPAVEESFVAAEPGVSSWRRPAARQERVATPPAAWESLEEPAVEAAPEDLAPSGPTPVADATFAPDPTPQADAVPQPEEIPADDEAVPPPTHWEQQPEPRQPLVQRRRLDALDEQDEPPVPPRPAKSAAKRQPAPTARESLATPPQPARQPGLEPKPEPDFSDTDIPDEAPSDIARRIRARVEQGLDPTPAPEPVAAAAPEPEPEAAPEPAATAPRSQTPAPTPQEAEESATTDAPADDQPQETTVRADGVRDIWARLQALDDRKAARPRLEHQRPAEDEPEEPARETVTDPVPWERQDVYGFFPALILTLRKILFQPLDFFGNLPEGRPKSKALVFNLLISEFLLLIDFMWSLAGLRARIGSPGEHDALSVLGSSPLSFLLALLLVPLVISVGIYLDAWVTHLLLILFRSTKKSFDETFRVLCYSAAPTVLTAVPVAGQLLSPVILVWYMALQAIGLKKCHEGAYTQTLAAIFIKWSIYLFLLLAMLQSFTPGMQARRGLDGAGAKRP